MITATNISLPLDKAQRDMIEADDALTTYWSRGPSDLDYKCADLHMAETGR